MRRARHPIVLAAAGLALCSACSGRARAPAGAGRRLAEGQVQVLRPSPDGSRLAWLDRCARPPLPQLPQGVLSCDLLVAGTDGGPAVRVAEGVSSLDLGFAWGQEGTLAALADYDYASGAGTLVRARPGQAPERLAPGVTFYGFGPGGILGYVARGDLHLAPPGGAAAAVAGGSGIATFDFDPADPSRLLARRQSGAGGELVRVSDGVARVESRSAAGDYAWSPDGRFAAATVRGADGAWDLELWRAGAALPPAALGHNVQGFAFARDGSALAFVAGMAPGRPGDLYVASLAALDEPGRIRPAVVAKGVGEFRWASAAPRLAWLESFDPRVRAGALAVGGGGAPAAVVGKNVTAFELAPAAAQVAFLEHVTLGGYSVDLMLSPAGASAPGTVARGVFGFDFSPDGRWLYYRTACVRNAEACDLYRVPASGLAAGESPQRVAEGVKSFEFDRFRPDRVLLGFARKDMPALDLAVADGLHLTSIDQAVLPGSARFLPPDGSRIAYAVVAPARAGLYLARLP